MKQFLCTLIIIGTGCFGLLATAEKIYKWVDQQGITHYSEQAPNHKKTAIINIIPYRFESKPQQPKTILPSSKALQPQLEVETALTVEQLAVQQKNCAMAESNLQALENAGRVRQLDPDSGDYIYLPDEVKLAQIQEMRDYIQDDCGR